MNEIIIKSVIVFIVCITCYMWGCNNERQYLLDVFSGKRKVKPGKNPFLKYIKEM